MAGVTHRVRMSRPPRTLPTTLQNGPFARAEAIALGVSPHRLLCQDIRHLGAGFHVLDGETVTEAGLLAALCRVHTKAIAHGLTAARLWGFPLPRKHQVWHAGLSVHVLGGPRVRGGKKGPFQWRRCRVGEDETSIIGADATRSKQALRLTSRRRTWADLLGVLAHDDLVAIGDHLVRRPCPSLEGRKHPFCTPRQLHETLGRRQFTARPAMHSVLADVRIGSDSPRETALRLACLRAGMPEPELNSPWVIDGADLATPDLLWREAKVCAEYEGASHLDLAQMQRDDQRRERRTSAGAREIRIFHGDLVPDASVATNKIWNALRTASSLPGE